MDKEQPVKQRKSRSPDVMGWTDYQDHETINAWLDSLQAEFPLWVTIETIGTSYEGRPMKMAKLSKKTVLEIKFRLRSYH